MADWTTLPNAAVGVGGLPSGTTVTALRDNPVAIAQGAAGAPKIQYAALDEGLAQQPAGGLGTYVFAWRNVESGITFGATLAGSQLRPAGLSSADVQVLSFSTVFIPGAGISSSRGTDRSTLSGTWRCMGESTTSGGEGSYPHTLWLRIS